MQIDQSQIALFVERALLFLQTVQNGVPRQELVEIIGLKSQLGESIIECMLSEEKVCVIGRGPGLRIVHPSMITKVDDVQVQIASRQHRKEQLDDARITLIDLLHDAVPNGVTSVEAQQVTDLNPSSVRFLFLQMMSEGRVVKKGTKTTTSYHLVNDR